MNNQNQFNQLVIACNRDDKVQLAGIQQKWKRPMMIRTTGEKLKLPLSVTLVSQCTASKEERNAAYMQAKSEGYNICGEVMAPFALQEFYTFQKEITRREPLLITVDSITSGTEIVELKNSKSSVRVKNSEKIKFGTDELLEGIKCAINARLFARNASTYTFKMLNPQIDQSARDALHLFMYTRKPKAKIVLQSPGTGYKYEFSIRRKEYEELLKKPMEKIAKTVKKFAEQHLKEERKQCKILLSGELFVSEEAVHFLKEELEDYRIYHYKAKEAVILGAAVLCNEMMIDNGKYDIKEENCCYTSEKMGAIRTLKQTQREVYYKLLDALLTGKEKFQMDDVKELPYESINVLKKDFPQTELLLEYSSSYFTDKLYVTLHYKDKGRELLKEVECVADKVLKECVREDLSDKEVFENIYNYICKHYRYQTEKDSEGNFPPASYTIAALLGSGVCKGYSLILIYILGKVQIPVSYIVGSAGTSAFNGDSLHAWNLLESTTGDVTHVDLTWDLGNTHVKKFQYHGDVAMQARTHFWQKSEYPACSI